MIFNCTNKLTNNTFVRVKLYKGSTYNYYFRGPFITALGRIWCPEHFTCVNNTCKRPLQDIGFVEENGQLYCEYCFEQFIAPACDKCHGKIKGVCPTFNNKKYSIK